VSSSDMDLALAQLEVAVASLAFSRESCRKQFDASVAVVSMYRHRLDRSKCAQLDINLKRGRSLRLLGLSSEGSTFLERVEERKDYRCVESA
jgi:hypothetical protein